MRAAHAAFSASLLLLAWGAAVAQGNVPAVVVQVAGSNLYLNAGTDAGIVAGDTLVVRRSSTAPPAGATAVIAATSTRSMVTFVGAPFAVTRGDTLFVTPGHHAADIVPAAQAAAPEPETLRPPVVPAPSGMRVQGALGFDMWGSHTTTVGLGSSPLRTTQDVGMPAMRLRARASDGGRSAFSLNLRAQQRSGPASMFDRSTSIRIYEAHYDRNAGALSLSLGRFYSDFDHASGFWDGASVRIGDRDGLSGGVAGGFEPARDNEGFSAAVGKYAAFVAARLGAGETRLATDLSFHQTLPRDTTPQRSVVDWSTRLNAGSIGMVQELEVSPPEGGGAWSVSRFNVRASAPIGAALVLYASAVSDRPPPLDSAWALTRERRENVAAGFSYRAGNWMYADLNASVNAPRDSTRGYTVGSMLAFPDVIGSVSASLTGNYFTQGAISGVTAMSSADFRVRSTWMRVGLQYLRSQGAGYSINTFGADFRVSRSITSRADWVTQVTTRYGANLQSATAFSSIEVRF